MNDENKQPDDQPKRVKPVFAEQQEAKKEAIKSEKPVEEDDNEFKLIVTITEYYTDKEQAEDSYKRFSGGGDNHVVLKQGSKTIGEKGWGARLDQYGHHMIDGRQHKIIYSNE